MFWNKKRNDAEDTMFYTFQEKLDSVRLMNNKIFRDVSSKLNIKENKMKFKVGDRVRCIKKPYNGYVGIIGKKYIIEDANENFGIKINGVGGNSFERFELVEEFSYKNHLIDFIESHGELETVSIIEQYNGNYNIVAVPLPVEEPKIYGVAFDNLSKEQFDAIMKIVD